MKEITMADLHQAHTRLGANEQIIDVRMPHEYEDAHVPGSINISHDQIAGHLNRLDPSQTYYLYCRSGGRVGYAAEVLYSSGFKNLNCVFDGGMPDWIDAGYPVVSGPLPK